MKAPAASAAKSSLTVLDTLAATGGFRPRIACRSSDYRFMSALVSAGVGVALVPRLGLPDNPRFVTWPSPRNPYATSASTAPVGAGGTQQPTASSQPSVTKPPL